MCLWASKGKLHIPNRLVEEGLLHRARPEQVPEGREGRSTIHEEEGSRGRHSKCKGPEAGACSACVRNIEECRVSEGKKAEELRDINSRRSGKEACRSL